ncbi:FAD-dependent oxidoreductase [Microbacterium sp. NEAU-LLB]|uniref:FAD-dependent oxidoreductase n=2 Tax=Microbacterium stercoris TaxID=2820289 RepID=A0A939TXH1_9MICO|nr:FAD-dependent oxidoreductase [Microbacterium stercoris]
MIPTDPTLPESTEVAVVGAGLTGLATAALLARSGFLVTVLEARAVGAVATGNTTAKVSLLQGSVMSELRKHAGDTALEAYVAANRAGQDWIRSELADDPSLEQRDAFTYSTTPTGDSAIDAEAEALAAVGLDVDVLGEGEHAGLPYPVTRALRMRGQWQIHPMRLLAHLAEVIREHGGSIVTDCRVLGLQDGKLRTSRGPLQANQVVVASGSPVIDKAGFFARLRVSRSLAAAYRVPGEVPSGMYLSVDAVGRSLRTSQGLLLVGGPSWTTGREQDPAKMLASLDEWVVDQFPGAARVTWWAAQDYQTVSRVPFVGPTGEGLWVATGFNKWGMTNGAAAALTLAGDLTGSPMPWAEALRSPHLTLRDGAEFIGAQAGVAAAAVTSAVRHIGRHDAPGACTHMGGSLEWNDLERTWDCPLHGSRFAEDGAVLEGPAVEALSRASK